MSNEPINSKINIFIRSLGALFIILGITFAFITSTTPIVTQILPIFYFISALLSLSGFLALISRIEP